jgi:hypothetical protein
VLVKSKDPYNGRESVVEAIKVTVETVRELERLETERANTGCMSAQKGCVIEF